MQLLEDIGFAFTRRCPVCRTGKMFESGLTVHATCPECGAPIGEHDIGDGAAVFMIFLLGFVIVPTAWALDLWIQPPIWVHAVLWGAVALAAIFVLMPVVKAYVILLQYRHRPTEWKTPEKSENSESG